MSLIKKYTIGNKTKIKILGFTVYKEKTGANYTEKTYFKIIKKYKKKYHNKFFNLKKIYLFNIKIFQKSKLDIRFLLEQYRCENLDGVRKVVTTALLHKNTFGEFKNIYQNKTVVLVGAGQSVNYIESFPCHETIYVGCNRAFLLDKIKFNYIFSIDKIGIQDYYNELLNYRGNNCIVFLGDQDAGINYQIPESYVNKLKNARRYKTSRNILRDGFTLDIDSEPLKNNVNVALQAIQFIFFTNPQKIYLVGLDCNTSKAGHFAGIERDTSFRKDEIQSINDVKAITQWQRCKSFRDTYYPETEIISVNPVGLKGIFRDVYTESYLCAHPEIKNKLGDDVEILKK